MIKRRSFISAFAFALASTSFSSLASDTASPSPSVSAIPYSLVTKAGSSSVNVNKTDISITAIKGTDLYTSADGKKSADNAPRISFEPKADFIFSAKVKANFTSAYDGGALFIHGGENNWAKLLFERFKSGKNGIASTVARQFGDDAYHRIIEKDEIYLKIVRRAGSFIFYFSEDGDSWSYLRGFAIDNSAAIKIGFLAQSPLSPTHQVQYSDIHFEEKTISDFWQGK